MHIGFDISQTGSGKAGCGYFAHATINAMLDIASEHRYTLLPCFGDFYFDARMPLRNPYKGHDVHYGPRQLTREAARKYWTSEQLEHSLGMPDVIHANNFWCPIQLRSSRLIYTLYDIGFTAEPSWTTEANRIGCFDGIFRSSIAADWIVAISEASRTHYLSVFPHFPAERIRVIHPCSRFLESTSPGQRPKSLDGVPIGGFWLSVGTIEPRKNQLRLVDAYCRYLALGGSPMPFVFAGGKGWLMDDFQTRIRERGIENRIIMTGYISDEELIWLYQNCYANLYPSFFEGFGLPLLEGMQFGAATIASASTSIPEVTGDAAILIDPEDTEGWAQTMFKIDANKVERDELMMSARTRAKQFSWTQSTKALLQLYEEATESPKRTSIDQ